jgi:membrane protease YdiL (CAAX protease family)
MNQAKVLAAAELALVILIFLGCNIVHVIPLGETLWILLLGWVSLRLRGKSWRSLGMVRPKSWSQTVALALTAAVFLQLLSTFVTEPLLTSITGHALDLSKFKPLVGDLKLTVAGLAVIWTLAAFGEELVYRGYLLNRAADLGGGRASAWIVSLISVSLLFGLGHLYQGTTGVMDTTVSGLLLGGLYLASGHNLWLPILTHGFTDTIALLLVFFDQVPAVHR